MRFLVHDGLLRIDAALVELNGVQVAGFGRRRIAAVAVLLAWVLMLSANGATAQTQQPPDQLDPPAEGESDYPDDPSEPEGVYTAAAQPSPTIDLSGRRWRNPRVQSFRAPQHLAGAVKASRNGWRRGSRSVVLTGAKAPAVSVAASALAGAVNAPLLLTRGTRLSDAPRREINRLDAERVFVVGLSPRVVRGVQRTGARAIVIRGEDRYHTSMQIAREAVVRGANARTVIVASGQRWRDGLGVAALAAGKQWPVLLSKRYADRGSLTNRVAELAPERVLVAARRSVVSRSVVSRLPNVTRLGGRNALGTAAKTARRAYAVGLDRRPVLVGAGHWADAATWGVFAGRRGSAALASHGPGLSRAAMEWLDDKHPRRITIVKAQTGIGPIAHCQAARGRQRSWFCAEQTLRRQGYHMPRVDGRADRFSVWAIYAFEKVARLRARGSFRNREWNKMLHNPRHKVRRPDLPKTHVEIDIGRQLILLVKNGRVRNHLHTSTGKASTPTVRGTFTIYEKRPYYQSHNHMYWPVFFYGGYAIHGYPSIPTYPASHGCARTYNGNMDFIYPRLFIGERVATY